MVWVTKRKPSHGTFVLVHVPEYCESGYQIAKWDGESWESDSGDILTDYVKGWRSIEKFKEPRGEDQLTFLQQIAELVLNEDDYIDMEELARIQNWPKFEGEPLSLENYEVKRLDSNQMVVFAGGDWQEPCDITIKQVDGALKVVSYVPGDISETEPFSEEDIIKLLK